ncbi:MAG: hypothetical protein M1828_001815 [Chrysothrix sp. TS-e1954]|nr:MAG: hypothetical protein M1828_001815 [Chrysothrix sp. TS-e1954]
MSLSLDRRLEIFAPRDDLFRRSNVHLYDVDYVKDFYHVDYELPEVRSDRFAPALPVEIWQKIVKDYKYQRADYAALCRSSSQLKAFAAPELYSVIGLRLCSAATKQSDENDKKGLPFPEMFPLVRELTLVSERAPAISYGRLLLSKFTSLRGLRFDKATFLEMFAGQELNGLQQWRALTVRSLVLDGDCGLLELQRLLQIPTLKDLKLQSCSLRLGTTQADRRAVSKSHLEGTSNVQVLHLGHWMVGPDYRVILRIPRRLTHFSAIVYKTSDWDAQSQQISTILGSQKSSLTYISLAHESHRNGLFEILGNLHNFVALRCLELDDWKHTRPSFLAPPRPSELSQLMLPAELETLKASTLTSELEGNKLALICHSCLLHSAATAVSRKAFG